MLFMLKNKEARRMAKVIINIDMDGVLANFDAEEHARERYKTEIGFFKNLKPIMANVNAVKRLIEQGYKVKIITKSPNVQADADKLAWLKIYLPEVDEKNIIFLRENQRKGDHSRGILFDDYGKNCKEWETHKKNIAYKIDELSTINYYMHYYIRRGLGKATPKGGKR